MLKRWLLLGLVVMLLLSLGGAVSCTGGGESPSAIVEAFYQAVNEGDIPKAQELVGDVQFMSLADVMVGNIQAVEILDELIAPYPPTRYGYEVWRAEVTVDVTLSPGFEEPPDWDWFTDLLFLVSPFPEGKHTLYLQKHDPQYRPEWKGEWIIRGSKLID